jgi:hypothetical protein
LAAAKVAHLAFNNDQRPSRNGETTTTPPMDDDPVEEATKIMGNNIRGCNSPEFFVSFFTSQLDYNIRGCNTLV